MDKLVYTYGNHKIYWSKVNNMYLLETHDQNGLWSNSMDNLIDEISKREKSNKTNNKIKKEIQIKPKRKDYSQLTLFKGDDVNG